MSLKSKTGKGGLNAVKALPAKRKVAGQGGRLGGKSGLEALRAFPKRRTAKVGAKVGAGAVATRPYVQAAVRDEDVRDNLEDAYRELIKAYGRISGRRGPTGAVLEDRRTRRHLKRAAHSMREAATTVRGAKQRTRRRRGAGVIIVVVAAGGAAAVAMNDDLRERLRAMVGAGEPSGPPQGSNGSGPTSVQPEGAPPSAATSTP